MKRLIKKATTEAVTAAEADEILNFKGLTRPARRTTSNGRPYLPRHNLNLEEMEIVQITLPLNAGNQRDQQPQIAFFVKKNNGGPDDYNRHQLYSQK